MDISENTDHDHFTLTAQSLDDIKVFRWIRSKTLQDKIKSQKSNQEIITRVRFPPGFRNGNEESRLSGLVFKVVHVPILCWKVELELDTERSASVYNLWE